MKHTLPAIPRMKKAVPIAGTVIILAAATASTFLWQGTPQEKPAFASVTDLPRGSTIHSTFEYRGGAQDLASTDGDISAPTVTLSPPYKFGVSVQLPENTYRDFSFSVSGDGKTLSVLADGFHAGDRVNLSVGGQNRFARLPADWSGKIELSTPLDGQRARACIEVLGRQETLGLCHNLPETGAS